MSIFDVKNQSRVHRLVQRALTGDRLPHAYIFHGPDGVGKEMIARRLAKILLCDEPTDASTNAAAELSDWSDSARDACGRCRSCHLVDVDGHPDLHLIYRQLNAHHPDSVVRNRKALDLGVDVIRHFVIDAVGVKPSCGRAKIFLIREANKITPAAQNALLKTLEEPPPTTFLFLLATGMDGLLSTTRSRCQSIGFAPLPLDFVADKLVELGEDVAPEEARRYAALSQGSLGTSLRYAEDDVISFDDAVREMLARLRTTNAQAMAGALLDVAKELSGKYRRRDKDLSETDAQRQALRVVFLSMATWYADLQHVLTNTTEMMADPGAAIELAGVCESIDLESVTESLSAIARAEQQIGLNANVQLCLDSVASKLARLRSCAVASVAATA